MEYDNGHTNKSDIALNAARYAALRAIICSGKGQQLMEEIVVDGAPPSYEELNNHLDCIIAVGYGL